MNCSLSHVFLFSLVSIFCTVDVASQEPKHPAPIVGEIVDDQEQALPYSAISIHSAQDSSLISGVAAGGDGRFSILAKPGRFLVKISFLSFSDKWLGPIEHSLSTTHLGAIEMSIDSSILGEVEVYAEREAVEFKLDKRVFNIQKDLNNRGRNASEILDNIPSVAVDVNGNVSLRGSENVRVLINGKPSGLIGVSSTDALRQLQGDLIEKIEVITNPSSKYEAEGEVGILNIILKKEKRKGVNGSIDLNAGIPDNHGAALNLNFRKKGYNLFTSTGLRYQMSPGNGYVYQEFLLADTSFTFDNKREHERGGLSSNFRLGSEIFLNANNTLTVSSLYSRSDGENELRLSYDDYDINDDLVRASERSEMEEELTEVLEIDLNYLSEFKGDGHQMTVSMKRQDRKDLEDSQITQTFRNDIQDKILQRSNNKENEENWVFQLDYERPFSKKEKLEMGLRTGLRSILNDYQVEQFDDGWEDVDGFVNELRYQEDIYAAYASYSSEKKKFGYQLGLRAEYSDVATKLVLLAENNPRSYLDIFPTAFFSYNYSESNAIQLSYSRRINRPRFWSLVPFYGYSDPRNFYSGNPDLNPEYVHSIELNRLSRTDKGSLIVGIYGRYKEGVSQRIVNVGEQGTSTFPVNLGEGIYTGFELSGSQSFYKWWRVNGSINIFAENFQGSWQGVDYGYRTAALQ